MKTSRTNLTLIIDRSGSMSSIKQATEKAFNDFIEEQKKLPGECTVTVVQFDDKYEVVFADKPLAEVGPIFISPRGGTALLDAIGKTINTLEEKLSKSTDEDTPDVVCVVVATDGHENSSSEYQGSVIKKLLDEKQNAQGWKFIYFGANQDAIATATQFGFRTGDTMSFAASTAGLSGASASLGHKMSAYRTQTSYDFTDDDRKMSMGQSTTSSLSANPSEKAFEDIQAEIDKQNKTP